MFINKERQTGLSLRKFAGKAGRDPCGDFT